MQCGSTGLGKMALKMKLEDESKMTKLPATKPPEGSLIMYCKTYDPVIWNVWISVEPEDLWPMIKVALSFKTLGWIIKSLAGQTLSKIGFGKKEAPAEKMETT